MSFFSFGKNKKELNKKKSVNNHLEKNMEKIFTYSVYDSFYWKESNGLVVVGRVNGVIHVGDVHSAYINGIGDGYVQGKQVNLTEEDDDNTESYKKITEEVFARRVSMMSIKFYSDNSSKFILYDDNIFFEHWIVVDVNEKGELEDAYIEG